MQFAEGFVVTVELLPEVKSNLETERGKEMKARATVVAADKNWREPNTFIQEEGRNQLNFPVD